MAYQVKVLTIASGFLIGIAFILFMVSSVLPIWASYGNKEDGAEYGLWRYCLFDAQNKTCYAIECPSNSTNVGLCNDKTVAARAFLTLACIFSCVAGVMWILFCSVAGDDTPWLTILINKILSVSSLVMGTIGVVIGIYVTMTLESGKDTRFGPSAVVGVVAVVVNVITAVTTLIVKH